MFASSRRFGKRDPSRFGKRAPSRFGKRDPSRFGKREPSRFGKRIQMEEEPPRSGSTLAGECPYTAPSQRDFHHFSASLFRGKKPLNFLTRGPKANSGPLSPYNEELFAVLSSRRMAMGCLNSTKFQLICQKKIYYFLDCLEINILYLNPSLLCSFPSS